MRYIDIIKLSLNGLSQRGLRSWLTILGIVIGVAAVVAILSMGAATQQSVSSQLGGLGANVISITPGFSRAAGIPGFSERSPTTSKNLTYTDLQIIKSISGVQFVDGIISQRLDISYFSESATITVEGVDPYAWNGITTSKLDSGRLLTSTDKDVVVIGYNVANTMFKKPLTLNTQLNIAGNQFTVVGILQQSGGAGFGDRGSDNMIIMPINSARSLMTDIVANQYSSIDVKVADRQSIDQVTADIESKLIISRHVTNTTMDFTVTSSQSVQQTISSVIGTLSLFLTGIAAISLLVGAIGIANTMFMSVMERTQEIGTLKALGTTNFEIVKMFVFESAMIGLIGGLIGIFLGFIASGTITELGIRLISTGRGSFGSSSIAVITPELVVFAIGFSLIIGILSGIFPARRAAKMQPIEALRYE